MKEGVVELTASLQDPHRDESDSFLVDVSERLFDHQYQAMTDPTILDPDNLELATCVVSRTPIPEPLKDGLISLGFGPVETDGGGRQDRSIFSRFAKNKRATLDKWRTPYLRARDVSPGLATFEEALIEETPQGSYADIAESGSQVLADAARTCFRQLVTPGLESLGHLERLILQQRSGARGRMVLHPAAVRALTCFVGETLRIEAPASRWNDDEDADSPLLVQIPGGATVATDPEFRVVKFVVRGAKEMLTTYVETVLGQAKT